MTIHYPNVEAGMIIILLTFCVFVLVGLLVFVTADVDRLKDRVMDLEDRVSILVERSRVKTLW